VSGEHPVLNITTSAGRDLGNVPVAVAGCDFRVASTAWRNALMLGEDDRRELSAALAASCGAEGLVVLETCNRVEWLLEAPDPRWAGELLRGQMLERWQRVGHPAPLPRPYLHTGDRAARHLVRVALGLESFVVGEREIAGQLNRALGAARDIGTASAHLNALQTTVGRVVKRVHRLTRFGATTRGVHGLAVDWLRHHLGEPDGQPWHVAVIGMGEIGRKAAALSESLGNWQVTRINRTVPAKQEGLWVPLAAGADDILAKVDGLILATGARRPILNAGALAALRDRPLPVVDLGTPAQIDMSGDEHGTIQHAWLDDLLVGHPRPYGDEDLQHVLDMVDEAVEEFRLVCRKRGVARLLRATQDSYDRLAYQQLPELLRAGAPELGREQATHLEGELRNAVRGYTRRIVREIEALLGGDPIE